MPRPRKPALLRPLRTMRIFCEGEKTEPNYLRGYLSISADSRRKSVIEVQKTKKNTPIQLVEEAIKYKNSPGTLAGDVFWVVYDRESPAKYSESAHKKAFDAAEREGIKLAISNVCFEYWILLHFVYTSAPYTCFDDLRRRSVLNSEFLKVSGADYEKSAGTIFDIVKDRLEEARGRGRRLNAASLAAADPTRTRPYQLNPFVGVVDLLDDMDSFVLPTDP